VDLGSFVILVVLGTSIWILFDAPNRDLSRWWALGALALWIVVFPLYLVERSKRQQRPATSSSPTSPPPGWYLDPRGEGHRWWNGKQWTDHRKEGD
jgi:hypothetical protein